MAKATVVENPSDSKVFGTSENNQHGGGKQRNRYGKAAHRPCRSDKKDRKSEH